MAENTGEVNHTSQKSPNSSKNFGRLRTQVVEAQKSAKDRFVKDGGPDVSESAFLGIAVDKVRAELNSELDKKTGLRNSHSFKLSVEHEIAEVKRNSSVHGLQVGMIDIDNFGTFNRTYGEQTGDLALKSIGDTLKASIRESDLAGRIGGEEFGVAFPYDKNTTTTEEKIAPEQRALTSAENIRKNIYDIEDENLPEKITASIGITEYNEGESFEDVQKRASLATLIAKLTGKNRTIYAMPTDITQGVYYDNAQGITYTSHYDPELKKLMSLTDTTNNIHYTIAYTDNSKPTL